METEWTCDETSEEIEGTSEGTLEWAPPPDNLPQLSPETLAAVRALRGGELQDSTRHIFATFEPDLSAYFRRHGCQDHEADDLTQTVFIQMLEQIGTLKDETSFHFWLFKIAGNYFRNFLRDSGRSREGAEDFADKAREDSEPSAFWVRGTFEPSPETKLTMNETVDQRRLALRQLLQVTKLAPRTRESLLRRLHGESYEEIALALEIPVGTAKSHISRASAALIKNLDKIDFARVEDLISLEDRDDDIIADLSSELLTFRREAVEADPAYFITGNLESASANHEEDEESEEAPLCIADKDDEDEDDDEDKDDEDDEDDEDEDEDDEDDDEMDRVEDSPAEIAAVVREDQARGRSRRRVARTILPAGRRAEGLALGRLREEDDLGYPVILLKEAAAAINDRGFSVESHLALKAKLTCASSILARGRRFKIPRQAEEIVQQAIVLINNGQFANNGQAEEIIHKIAEGRALLRSYLDQGDLNHDKNCH